MQTLPLTMEDNQLSKLPNSPFKSKINLIAILGSLVTALSQLGVIPEELLTQYGPILAQGGFLLIVILRTFFNVTPVQLAIIRGAIKNINRANHK